MGNFSFAKKRLFKKVIQINSINPLGLRPFQALSFNWSLEPDTGSVRKLGIKIIVNSLGVIHTFKDKRNCQWSRKELWSIGLTDIKSSFIASGSSSCDLNFECR